MNPMKYSEALLSPATRILNLSKELEQKDATINYLTEELAALQKAGEELSLSNDSLREELETVQRALALSQAECQMHRSRSCANPF